MTNNQIRIRFLVTKLRRKYEQTNNVKANDMLDRILWYSYPVVYWQTSEAEEIRLTMEAERRKSKKYRTRKYLKGMESSYDELYFLTFTFTDTVLDSTKEATRKKYVQRWLNEYTRDYYANVDYGERNQREHYHALVSFVPELARKDAFVTACHAWHVNGAIDVKKYRKGDAGKVSTYLNKLCNHANKVSTGKSFHKKGLVEVDNLPF